MDAAKKKALSPAGLAALRVLLLLVVALFLPQTRVWALTATPQHASGEISLASSFSIGENGPALAYDVSGCAVAAEETETFYRTMSQANYDALAATGKLPATSETFISPSLEYAQQYNGVTVQFNMQAGTQNALMGMGVRNSAAGFAGTAYEGLPMVQSGWGSSSAFFKMEGDGLV
jgi:hypothetical protein